MTPVVERTRHKSKPSKVGGGGKQRRFRRNKGILRAAVLPEIKEVSPIALERFAKRPAPAVAISPVFDQKILKDRLAALRKQEFEHRRERRAAINQLTRAEMEKSNIRRQFRIPSSVPEHLIDWYISRKKR